MSLTATSFPEETIGVINVKLNQSPVGWLADILSIHLQSLRAFKVKISVPGKKILVNIGTDIINLFRKISNFSDFLFVFVNDI